MNIERPAGRFWNAFAKHSKSTLRMAASNGREPMIERGMAALTSAGRVPLFLLIDLLGNSIRAGFAKVFVFYKVRQSEMLQLKHLFLGSIPDNNADMDRKGRRKSGPLRGEAHPQAVMTVASVRQVRRLRATGLSAAKIAARLDVNLSTVSNIVHGDAWKHVT
jgi:hypothetical protein